MNWEESPTVETKEKTGPAQVGTVIFLVLTGLVFLCYLVIFVNPQIPLNPFPPLSVHLPTPTAAALAAATPTMVPPTFTPPRPFPPTWTPTATPTPTATFTPKPTSTPAPPTSTPIPLPAFSLDGNPVYTSQKLYESASDWWTGVAGEISDRNNKPVTDVTVRVWDDRGHSYEVKPGDASDYAKEYDDAYGGGGTYAWWEQVLDASCHQSIAVHVQVLRNGKPASNVVNVETTADCNKNLILIFFRKNY
jgi:hypothetical protein